MPNCTLRSALPSARLSAYRLKFPGRAIVESQRQLDRLAFRYCPVLLGELNEMAISDGVFDKEAARHAIAMNDAHLLAVVIPI